MARAVFYAALAFRYPALDMAFSRMVDTPIFCVVARAGCSPTDGLADNPVWAVAVAPDGALWFGTEAGASRFDRKSWSS